MLTKGRLVDENVLEVSEIYLHGKVVAELKNLVPQWIKSIWQQALDPTITDGLSISLFSENLCDFQKRSSYLQVSLLTNSVFILCIFLVVVVTCLFSPTLKLYTAEPGYIVLIILLVVASFGKYFKIITAKHHICNFRQFFVIITK